MLGEDVAHALAGAFAPQRDDDALTRRLQRIHVLGHGLEHVAAGLGALGREIVTLFGAGIDHLALLVRHRERRQARERGGVQPLAPLGLGQIEADPAAADDTADRRHAQPTPPPGRRGSP